MSDQQPSAPPARVDEPLVEVRDLHVTFRGRGRRGVDVPAVAGVSFDIARSETFALVGESGSGKSTTARAALQLVAPTAGEVRFDGVDLTTLGKKELRRMRRRMQMVFQDPYSSLDPSAIVADSVGEPLEVHLGLSGDERDARVAELFDLVGLSPTLLYRYPHEFSGGQRQRLAIARAIALDPDLVVCDEAVSALDVSTQNQVIKLLRRLADELGVAYLFITHDLAVVRHIAQRVGVMYLGRIVEQGPVEQIFERPAHPYTEALLSAVPLPDPVRQRNRERILLRGDLPDPSSPPPGCRFHTRCPYVMDICREVDPPATIIPGTGPAGDGVVHCHLHTSGPNLAGDTVIDLAPTRPASATSTASDSGVAAAAASSGSA